MSSEYPQSLRSPQISASTVKVGVVTINNVATEIITTQNVALYLESISVTFYDSSDVEVPTGTLRIFVDVTDQSTPTIVLTPNDVRTKYKIASLSGGFLISSQSPGSIIVQPVNPLATSFLKITCQGTATGDKVSRIVIWRV